jgi:hypothetical protein
MPALVVGNEPDFVHPLSFARIWAERLPRGRFAQVPSKLIDFDRHAEAFRICFSEFLKSLGDGSFGPMERT